MDALVIQHLRDDARRGEALVLAEHPIDDLLRLDPPGLEVPVADMLGPAPTRP